MKPAEEQDYREFVAARIERLRRTAYLLCRDWHTADDLVSITIGKVYRRRSRVRAAENVDTYVRGILTRAWLDERRRPWRREAPTAALPEFGRVVGSGTSGVGDRLMLGLHLHSGLFCDFYGAARRPAPAWGSVRRGGASTARSGRRAGSTCGENGRTVPASGWLPARVRRLAPRRLAATLTSSGAPWDSLTR